VRIGALHHFAVQFEHQPEHAVRGRVLRAEIDRVVSDFRHARYSSPYFGSRTMRGVTSRGSIVTGW